MQVTLKNDGRLAMYAREIHEAAAAMPKELAGILNRVGTSIRKQTIAAEARQTGLSRRVIEKAQKARPADAANLSFRIQAAGGNISLKYFRPYESPKGVISTPLGVERLSPSAFLRGGRFPNRVALRLGGNVFMRTGAGRSPLKMIRSNVYLADEMVTGSTAAAFDAGVAMAMPNIMREVAKLLP